MTTLVGTGRLMRFVVRRDRLRLVVWVVGMVTVVAVSAQSLDRVYATRQAVESYVRLFGDNPALVAFAGPGYGFDDPNVGVILVNETQLWGMVAMALMSVFLVIRHTRAEEDSERAELLRAAVVGRHAPTAAAVVVIAVAETIVGLLAAVSFVAIGYPVVGSIALAASYTAVGLVFVGVAVVVAQLVGSARAALGLASLVLVVAFVVRAVGDIGHNALVWVSPIGWAQAVRAYADEQWWVFALCAVVAVGLVASAFALASRRDVGAGLVPPRPGSTTAAARLSGPVGLVVRLERATVAAWVLGMALMGLVYGSIADDVESMLVDNPQLADYFARLEGADITDVYFATTARMLALVVGGLAVAATLAAHREERSGRVEALLAAAVDRRRWLGAHLGVAAFACVLAVLAGGAGAGLSAALVLDEPSRVGQQVVAALATLPAVFVVLGVAALGVGVAPRMAGAAWGVLAFVAVVGFLGEALDLPHWLIDVSPFEQLPAVPAESFGGAAPGVLSAVAVVLVLLSLWGVHRRDVGVH